MSAEENIKKAAAQLKELGVKVNAPLLEKIVKGLGIANRNRDASLVAASDPEERKRVRTNFVEKKLGIQSEAVGDVAIDEVMAQLSGINQKSRGAVYYLLAEKLGKADVFLG